MTDFSEDELRRRIDRRVAPLGGEVASHEVRIAELESKLANILLPAEVAGYIGETELDTLRNIAGRAVAATANLETTQASMLGVAANLNVALEELRATISGTIAELSDADTTILERLALAEDRINELAVMTTAIGTYGSGENGMSVLTHSEHFDALGTDAEDILAPSSGEYLVVTSIMITGKMASGSGRIILIDSASGLDVASGDFGASEGGFVWPIPAGGIKLSAADAKLQVKSTAADTVATVNVTGYSASVASAYTVPDWSLQ